MALKKTAPTIEGCVVGKEVDVGPLDKKDFTKILIRIPNILLIGLDLLLDEKPWLNRTQWIVDAIHQKLTNDIKAE
jgi:hypothetical protein